MNGRSLLCVAHQIAAERHGELLARLEQADAELRERSLDLPQADELAATLVDEALELLRGPKPNYAECLTAMFFASERDDRYTGHWRRLEAHVEHAMDQAMERLIDLAEREDAAELRGDSRRGAVN